MTEKQLKELIREEYHNVKNFMEEKYGFAPELGKVVDNPYVSAFRVEDYLSETDSIDEAKKVKIKFDEFDNMLYFSDGEKAQIDYDGEFKYKGKFFDTTNMKGSKDLEKALNKAFPGTKFIEELAYDYDVETIEETKDFINFMKEYKSDVNEAEYQGRDVKLGKPMQGDVKKFKVYVKNDKGNVVKVNFGAKGMTIKKDNPERRKSFRARHNCDNPGPRWKARYWSCRKW